MGLIKYISAEIEKGREAARELQKDREATRRAFAKPQYVPGLPPVSERVDAVIKSLSGEPHAEDILPTR